MSQVRFKAALRFKERDKTTCEGRPVEVVAGWDRPLQGFYLNMKFRSFFEGKKLFCTWHGERWRVTGASRLGDVWLTFAGRRTMATEYGNK